MRVEAFILDAPAPVSLGDFADEADALAAVHGAQARGVITRTPAGVTLIPAARVVRYEIGTPPPAPVVAVVKARAKRRAR